MSTVNSSLTRSTSSSSSSAVSRCTRAGSVRASSRRSRSLESPDSLDTDDKLEPRRPEGASPPGQCHMPLGAGVGGPRSVSLRQLRPDSFAVSERLGAPSVTETIDQNETPTTDVVNGYGRRW